MLGDKTVKIRLLHFGFPGLAWLCAACGAAAPTPELLTARNAYAQARNGEAAQLNPRGVHEAYKALQTAEAAHADDGGSSKERNYAYIATRRSELAIAQASEALARKEQQRADETYRTTLEQHTQQLQQQTALAAAQNSQYAQQLTQTQEQLQANAQALQERERKLQEAQQAAARAQQELRQMESMREEAGRLVISLSGVLFESGGDKLSSMAERRLDTVAQALTAYADRDILVEGYTDSQGDATWNRELSQRRADSARQYLERRGVPGARIRSVGRGEEDPVASNETPEGRANNRRVEIIVQPPAAGQSGSGQAAPATGSSSANGGGNSAGQASAPDGNSPGSGREPLRATPPQ
jgi:outer membrane protein OmpA-like peptidoglycan-associated protein